MKRDILESALDNIQDRHIAAALQSKKRHPYRLAAIAAALAAVILLFTFTHPLAVSVKAVSTAASPRVSAFPSQDFEDDAALQAAIAAWLEAKSTRAAALEKAVPSLTEFFAASSTQILSSSDNTLWSPANAYLSLAMLAELAGGSSQQQLLNLLGSYSLTGLREQISALWETVYADDGNEICTLANSLWLSEDFSCSQSALDTLAYHYYASTYQGQLGSPEVSKAIGTWLDDNTGGLLKAYTGNIQLPPDTVFSLYSTLFFQSKWVSEFYTGNNTEALFYAPTGDYTTTFMNRAQATMQYYWGNTYGAVSLPLKNGSQMWLILPDEGLTPEDILADMEYAQMISTRQWENSKAVRVNLSVPKFDISSSRNLREDLQALGVTDIFSPNSAQLSAVNVNIPAGTKVTMINPYVSAVNQAVRVQIDETGVKAAAYVEIPTPGAAMPPEELIDFTLNRPFLFVITSSHIPLYAGVVNEP